MSSCVLSDLSNTSNFSIVEELLTKEIPRSKSSLSSLPLELFSENSKFLNVPISPDCLTFSISTIGDASIKEITIKDSNINIFLCMLIILFRKSPLLCIYVFVCRLLSLLYVSDLPNI